MFPDQTLRPGVGGGTEADFATTFGVALGPDERLLWTGAPLARLRCEWRGAGDAIVAITWCAMTAFGFVGFAHAGPTSLAFASFVLVPFALAGAQMLIGVHLWRAFERRHTRYALTTRNVWIATRHFARNRVDAHPLDRTMPLAVRSDASGRTDIILKRVHVDDPERGTILEIGFEQIGRPREVLDLLTAFRAGEFAPAAHPDRASNSAEAPS